MSHTETKGQMRLYADICDTSIQRIKTFEPPDGYYVAFSGGKDSTVLLDLIRQAGVKYDAHYNYVGIDPPELVKFIRENYPDVHFVIPKERFGKAFLRKMFPPMRQQRWCCELLKEGGGAGRFVCTGIRAAESRKRAKRSYVEGCTRDPTRRYLHPIIDWTDDDVWCYIKSRGLKYCSLYDEGRRRLGCLFCPMQSPSVRVRDAKRWPKMAHAFISLFRRLLGRRLLERRLLKQPDSWKLFGHGDATDAFWAWLSKGRHVDGPDADQTCFRFAND